MGKHRILAAASVFSGAPTLFSALRSRGLASGPRAAGGGQKLQRRRGIGGSGRRRRERLTCRKEARSRRRGLSGRL